MNPNPKRVLAVDPTSKGFGFVVLEAPAMLVDWGTRTTRPITQDVVLAKVLETIRHYQPEVLVLEDPNGSRRGERVRSLLDALHALATAEGIKSRRVRLARLKTVFRTFGAKTKQEIACVVAHQLPELAPELPANRKAWESEDYHMAVFDAAAFALTYFNSRLLRSRLPKAKLESTAKAIKP